jgi:1-deoxy-D-xylulose-5-phosphate reductoisomerase
MQVITILGATGSVGRSTADVLLHHRDRFSVGSVVGGSDAASLARLAKRLGARFAAIADEAQGAQLRSELSGSGIANGAGASAVLESVQREADLVVAAISGAAGLRPTHAALKPGRRIALANKETLVCAGAVFMAAAQRIGAEVLPLDSEHNALHQALSAGPIGDVVSMTITASGGPFRTWSLEAMESATPAQAAAHPTYAMGTKINIDSATLMNKGLELIEAHHLFGLPADRLDVVVHPQSVVHGLVQWRDGMVTAGLAMPDMKVPIAHCLGAGDRLEMPVKRLDLAALGSLTFEPPDERRFPCLALARRALEEGGAMPTILNAANEVAVEAFIAGRIGFLDIARIVEQTCDLAVSRGLGPPASVEEALDIDREARQRARERLPGAAAAAPLNT